MVIPRTSLCRSFLYRAKPRFSEHISPVPWPFVISRFHCSKRSIHLSGQSTFKAIQTIYKRGNNDSTLTLASTDLAMNARRAKQQKEEMIRFATILKEKMNFCLQKVSFSGALLSFNSVLGLSLKG